MSNGIKCLWRIREAIAISRRVGVQWMLDAFRCTTKAMPLTTSITFKCTTTSDAIHRQWSRCLCIYGVCLTYCQAHHAWNERKLKSIFNINSLIRETKRCGRRKNKKQSLCINTIKCKQRNERRRWWEKDAHWMVVNDKTILAAVSQELIRTCVSIKALKSFHLVTRFIFIHWHYVVKLLAIKCEIVSKTHAYMDDDD